MSTTNMPGLPEAFSQCKGFFGGGVTRHEMRLPKAGAIPRTLVVLVKVTPLGYHYTGQMQLPGLISQEKASHEWPNVLAFLEEIIARG